MDAIQAIIVALLGSTFGLIVLLIAIIGGVLLYYYKKGIQGDNSTAKKDSEEKHT